MLRHVGGQPCGATGTGAPPDGRTLTSQAVCVGNGVNKASAEELSLLATHTFVYNEGFVRQGLALQQRDAQPFDLASVPECRLLDNSVYWHKGAVNALDAEAGGRLVEKLCRDNPGQTRFWGHRQVEDGSVMDASNVKLVFVPDGRVKEAGVLFAEEDTELNAAFEAARALYEDLSSVSDGVSDELKELTRENGALLAPLLAAARAAAAAEERSCGGSPLGLHRVSFACGRCRQSWYTFVTG